MFKRYELHNHTIESDAGITCKDLLKIMINDHVDCFAITDHNTVSGQKILRELLQKEKLPIQCLYGMEYTTYYGHIVCPILETYVPWDSINRFKPELLFEDCKKANGITGVAHPFAYGAPYARGCRFDMTIHDFTHVDYIEIINNAEPLHINLSALNWWESLVLKGEKIAAGAGMDLHGAADMSMDYATYAEGEPNGDCADELRNAMHNQRTWVSNGMILNWRLNGDKIRFEVEDVKKPGFVYPKHYTLTLRNSESTRSFDITKGTLDLPVQTLADVEIPKLYAGDPNPENLICVSPVIRNEGGTNMPSYENYRLEMDRNLMLMSRTANGIVDTSASADKASYMLIQSGENAAKTAQRNVQNAFQFIYENRSIAFENADALRRFLLKIAAIVNDGVLQPDHLMRSGADSELYHYIKIANLPAVFASFCDTLLKKIQAVPYDAVEAACFAEYGINLTGHFFADGCGKCAMLTAAFLLMRADLPLPDYRSREEYFQAIQAYPKEVGTDYLDAPTYEAFLRYYRSCLKLNFA